jgi:hypothetical protein
MSEQYAEMIPISEPMTGDDVMLRSYARRVAAEGTPRGGQIVPGSVTYEIPQRALLGGQELPPLPGEWPGPVMVVRWQVDEDHPR